ERRRPRDQRWHHGPGHTRGLRQDLRRYGRRRPQDQIRRRDDQDHRGGYVIGRAMRIDSGRPFTDLDGKPISEEGRPLTFGVVAIRAILSRSPGDTPDTPEQSIAHYDLALRRHRGGEVEISAKEATELAARIAKFWAPIVA